ncbi:MAG TPA: ATP-binding protein [Phycisphaerales bacterium]|nr:ATP-binding protein [Phycisphaerales bacterium]
MQAPPMQGLDYCGYAVAAATREAGGAGHVHQSGAGGADAGAAHGGFWSSLTEVFTPRRVCMNDENDVVWLHIVSDAMIALAYFSIPLALIYFVRRRKDLAFNWMFVLFATFILACGTTHVFGLMAIWKPYYRIDGIVKLLTGLVSIATAILLWPLVNKALLLPSPSQLRVANDQLNSEVVERLKAEEQLRRSAEQLERRVQERTAELQTLAEQRTALLDSERRARAEAERASRVKDDFVATLSHELRTPISSILGWTHLLRADPARPDAAYGLEVIERNTRAQARMIDDLLDVSRIVAGKLRLDVQPVDLAAVLRAAIEIVRPAAEAKGVRLVTELDGGALVRGDAARLQQIAWNLLSNAIKFTPGGGAAEVRVSLKRTGAHAELTVRDNGKGISREFLPYIFDRFRQEDASTTRLHGGLGLGLSIVRHLTELHGGTVSARSEGEGLGSTFTVSLPLAAAPVTQRVHEDRDVIDGAPTPSRAAPSAPLDGVRILLVDDDLDTRELLSLVLSKAGAHVVTAASSTEGLVRLQSDPSLEVIVSDVGMPDEDGYAFIRKVRQIEEGRGTPARLPAIALTAFARSEDRTRALKAGFQAHIAKPAEPAELITVIASLVGRIH